MVIVTAITTGLPRLLLNITKEPLRTLFNIILFQLQQLFLQKLLACQ